MGFSSNYSGAGFSHMRFAFHASDDAGFEAWVAKVRGAGATLDRPGYLALEKPSEKEPVRHYASIDAGLYDAILNRCVDPRRMCAHEMMAIDAAGGRPARQSGLISLTPRARGDIRGRPFVPAAVCNVDEVPKPAFTLALSAP